MNWRDKVILFASAACLAFATGCSAENGSLDGNDKDKAAGNGGETPGAEAPKTPEEQEADTMASCRAQMKVYKGFGDADLTKERVDDVAGRDRFRVKPYSALNGEFQRVLGSVPASLQPSAAAFGTAPARWQFEPTGSAIIAYTTYRIAFDGALTYTGTDAKFNTAPSEASASTECAAFIRKAWSRTGTPDEINACKTVAVTDTASETEPRRRWAYAFASVLTAAGFTTY